MMLPDKYAEQVALLEELARFDAEIKRLDVQLAEETAALEAMKRDLAGFEARLAAEKASLDELQKTASEVTGEARQMGQQIERSREKMGRARNERESMAAERELDELRRLLRDREEEAGKLNSLAEQARKSIADVQGKRDKLAEQLSSSESSTTSKLTGVAAEREKAIAERGGVASKVLPPTLKRYELVRKKRATALAKSADGMCLSCHILLPPQLFQRVLRQDSLEEECPRCRRILYIIPKPSPDNERPT